MIRFRCQACQKKIAVPVEHGGRRCRCPRCNATLVVPTETEVERGEDASVAAGVGGGPVTAERAGAGGQLIDSQEFAVEAAPPRRATIAPSQRADAPLRGPAPRAVASTDTRREDASERTSPHELINRREVKLGALGALGLLLLAAIIFGNVITAFFTALIAIAIVNGYWLGASRIAAVFGGLFAAALVAVPLGRALESALGGIFGTTGLTNRLVSVLIVVVLIVSLIAFVLQLVIRKWLKGHPKLVLYDRPAGAGLGLLEGALMGVIMMWAVMSMEPIAATGVTASHAHVDAAPNPVAERVLEASQSMRESVVGRAADSVNPLKNLRLFTLFQKVLVVLNDPAAREAFVNHEAIVGIQSRPSVQQAVALLQEDEELVAIIDGESGITAAALRRLLDSDVLLRIFDDTGIVEDLRPMTKELERAIEDAYAQVRSDDDAGEQREQ